MYVMRIPLGAMTGDQFGQMARDFADVAAMICNGGSLRNDQAKAVKMAEKLALIISGDSPERGMVSNRLRALSLIQGCSNKQGVAINLCLICIDVCCQIAAGGVEVTDKLVGVPVGVLGSEGLVFYPNMEYARTDVMPIAA